MKYTITPQVNFDTGDILINTEIQNMMNESMEKLSTEIMRTKEQATRKALIALGWTPPDVANKGETK